MKEHRQVAKLTAFRSRVNIFKVDRADVKEYEDWNVVHWSSNYEVEKRGIVCIGDENKKSGDGSNGSKGARKERDAE
jgi:uncharacterized protein YijF (DUF1287 family)